GCRIAADGTIRHRHRAAIVDAAAVAVPARGTSHSPVTTDRAVDQRRRRAIVDATAYPIGIGPAHSQVIFDPAVADDHAAFIVQATTETALSRWAPVGRVAADDRTIQCEIAKVLDSAPGFGGRV